MNLGFSTILLTGIASFVLAGCASPSKSFLDASVPKVAYRDIEKSGKPLRLKLAVEFQRNGEHFPKGDIPLRDYTARILENTGVISPIDAVSAIDDQGEGVVKVVLNNIADRDTVTSERARTGLPLWVLGKTLTETYEMSMFITAKGKTLSRTGIKQAFHTAIGNMDVPTGIETFPSGQAFGKMLEQMILRALQGMQKGGELGKR